MCHGAPCDLPFCTYRSTGKAGGIGRKKAEPSERGRDQREKRKAEQNPICEIPGCGQPTDHVHHVGGRGLGGHRRKTAPLEALCQKHHDERHGIKQAAG